MSAFDDYCIICEKLTENGTAYCSEACRELDKEVSTSPSLSVSSISNLPDSTSAFFSLSQRAHSKSITNSSMKSFSTSMINSPNLISHNTSTSYSGTNIPIISTMSSSIISPLLTPQVIPNKRNSVVGSIKSPNLKDLTYESPLLMSTSVSNLHESKNNIGNINSMDGLLNDLDSNRLDLNSSTDIKFGRLSLPLKHANTTECLLNNSNNNNSNTKRLDLNEDTRSKSASDTVSNTMSKKKKITNVSNMLHSSSENYKKWLSIH